MKSNAEHQRDYRKRQAELGRKEIRGIYVTDKERAVIRKLINGELAKMRKGKK